MMENGAVRMAALIDNILDFARGRLSGGLPLKRDIAVMLEPLLRQVVAELQTNWRVGPSRWRSRSQNLSIAIPVVSASWFSNLSGNALTHGALDKPIRIEATPLMGRSS
jgi:sigma-B regulation protein RsbU (phosphoserine phosphatase)